MAVVDRRRNHLRQVRRRLNRCRKQGVVTERDLDYIGQDLAIAECEDEGLLEEVALLEMKITP